MYQHRPQHIPEVVGIPEIIGGILSALILHGGSVLGVCVLWSLVVGAGWFPGIIIGAVIGALVGTFVGLTIQGRREFAFAAGMLFFPIWVVLCAMALAVWFVRMLVA